MQEAQRPLTKGIKHRARGASVTVLSAHTQEDERVTHKPPFLVSFVRDKAASSSHKEGTSKEVVMSVREVRDCAMMMQ